MEYNQYKTIRDDLSNVINAMNNDDLEDIMNKNFGVFPKKNIIRIFLNRRNEL